MERTRLLFIDNLRILLITLVITLHLSVTYGGEGSWYYKEGQADILTSVVLTFHNAVSQSFFMGFLFMISGYFTPGSYDRKGPWRFLVDRLLRLGIPMLCYDFVINPLLAYPLIKAHAWDFDRSYREFLAIYYTKFHIGTGPLWFVESLLIFAVIYVLWRAVTSPKHHRGPDTYSFPNKQIGLFALILGAVTFAVRIWLPVGWSFEPLNLQFPFLPQYICMFTIGVIAYRRNYFLRISYATGKFWLGVAVILIVVPFPIMFMLGGALKGDVSPFAGGVHWQCFTYALWEQSLGCAMIITLLVFFRERLNRQKRLAKAMSASAYTAYIIHGPILVLLTLAIRKVGLYPLAKFGLAAVIAVPLCFGLGNVIRKLPLARRIL